MTDLLGKTRRYLDDHWMLKWFVVPILLMASVLFVLGAVMTTATETLQLTGLFAGFSLAVVAVGLLLDWAVRSVTGGSLFTSNRDHGEEWRVGDNLRDSDAPSGQHPLSENRVYVRPDP